VQVPLPTHLVELQLVDQEVPDELDWLVEGKAQARLTDTRLDLRQAGTGVHHNGELATLKHKQVVEEGGGANQVCSIVDL
jgi:hypothetical protein